MSKSKRRRRLSSLLAARCPRCLWQRQMLESLSGKTCHAGTQSRQQRNITSCWPFNERSLDRITSFNTCQRRYKNFYLKKTHVRTYRNTLLFDSETIGGGQWRPRPGGRSHARCPKGMWETAARAALTFARKIRQRSDWVQRADLALTYQRAVQPRGTAHCGPVKRHGSTALFWGLCASGPECEWASRARGQARMTTRCCTGQLGRSHATDIRQSGDDTLSRKLNKHGLLVGRFTPRHGQKTHGDCAAKWHAQAKITN